MSNATEDDRFVIEAEGLSPVISADTPTSVEDEGPLHCNRYIFSVLAELKTSPNSSADEDAPPIMVPSPQTYIDSDVPETIGLAFEWTGIPASQIPLAAWVDSVPTGDQSAAHLWVIPQANTFSGKVNISRSKPQMLSVRTVFRATEPTWISINSDCSTELLRFAGRRVFDGHILLEEGDEVDQIDSEDESWFIALLVPRGAGRLRYDSTPGGTGIGFHKGMAIRSLLTLADLSEGDVFDQ